jgi:hypothetical protein
MRKQPCGVSIIFGDDFADNECTFHCELEKGHIGKHIEKGDMGDKKKPIPYKLEWEGNSEDS